MSVRVVNGKIALDRKPKHLDAPTPSQIAERAYDLAVETAIALVEKHVGDRQKAEDMLKDEMRRIKPADLAALRESVINPGVLPWWRKPQ